MTRASEFWEYQKYLNGGCKEDGARLFSVVTTDKTGGNWHKLEHRRLSLNMSKNFTEKMMSAGTSCPETWWSLHPWSYSEAMWMWSWAAYSRWLCLSRDVRPVGPQEVPSNLTGSVILWTVPHYLISHCQWASRTCLTLLLGMLCHGSSIIRLSHFWHYLLSDLLSD